MSIQEAFTVARLAFASFKMKVRATLAVTHNGPETLEEAVQDYINRNPDLYDVAEMVSVSSHCVLDAVDLDVLTKNSAFFP